MDRLHILSRLAMITTGTVALFVALHWGQAIIAPTVLALVVGIVMSPISDGMRRVGLPPSAAALSSLFIILVLMAGLYLFLEPVIFRALDSLPIITFEINRLILDLKAELRGLESLGEGVERALGSSGSPPAPTPPQAATGAEDESMISVEQALYLAPAILSQATIFIGALFFFILSKDEIYRFIARRLVPDELRLETANRLRCAERQVGRYFLTISVINASYAVVIGAAMIAIGMPSPILWGIAAGIANFVLYLGPAIMAAAFLLGGLVAFDGAMTFAPMAIYLAVNIIEAQFVTPAFVGKALQVNPLAVFLALVLFLWLWGPIGGFIAIPLLLWVIVLIADIKHVRATAQQKNPKLAPEPQQA